MNKAIRIPVFPLSILPLPGELVPLHIFEPRYRQLLRDLETLDIRFVIYFSNEINTAKVGSLMRLESIIKRYPGGESDIIVRCEDIVTLDTLHKTFRDKLYPGGDVETWDISLETFPSNALYENFAEYLKRRSLYHRPAPYTVFDIAVELQLDLNERYRFVTMKDEVKSAYLLNQVKFQLHVLGQEDLSKDVFHLN